MHSNTIVALLSVAGAAFAQQTAWGQCMGLYLDLSRQETDEYVGGGTGWSGATTCVSGYVCMYSK